MRRLAGVAAAVALFALQAAPAQAKSFHIAGADVAIEVQSDGAVVVTENLTFDFDGSFSGAYRDVEVGAGQTFELVSVSDESGAYQPGGCTVLGCSSPPGTFGVENRFGDARIVWHHSSNDELRTFQIVYRMTGLVEAHDDIADLFVQVWGDEWSVRADQVTARVDLPEGADAGEVLVFGHPFGVDGETSLGSDGVSPSLVASGVSPNQFVEIRVVFPRSLLTSTTGAVELPGAGRDDILAEEASFAEEATRPEPQPETGSSPPALLSSPW